VQSLFIPYLAVSLALMTSSALVEAQERTYDEAALRLESDLSGIRIVRGISDSVVLTAGLVKRSDVTRLVASSQNAVTQAKIFEANYRQGVWTGIAGLAVWAAVYGINHIGTNQPVTAPTTFVSIALVVYGAIRVDSAKRALSKAIWWYNRELKV
jgi:hypothetical protein